MAVEDHPYEQFVAEQCKRESEWLLEQQKKAKKSAVC